MKETNRRQFLTRAATFAALGAFAMPSELTWANPLGLPIGIQLFAVSQELQKDTSGTLKKLAGIGYKEVEPLAASIPGFSAPVGTATLRKMLDDNGLKAPSAFLNFDLKNLNRSFDQAHTLGCSYCTTGGPRTLIVQLPSFNVPAAELGEVMRKAGLMMEAPVSGDELMKIIEAMNTVGDAARKQGLHFASHNGTFEFNLVDGKPMIYEMISKTDPDNVKFEIDCGWAEVAGYNPVDLVNKFPGRVKMLHIKDFMPWGKNPPAGAGTPKGTELGTGSIDYKPIFAGLKGKGVEHIFVEQEGPFDRMSQMESAEIDYKYVHALF